MINEKRKRAFDKIDNSDFKKLYNSYIIGEIKLSDFAVSCGVSVYYLQIYLTMKKFTAKTELILYFLKGSVKYFVLSAVFAALVSLFDMISPKINISISNLPFNSIQNKTKIISVTEKTE